MRLNVNGKEHDVDDLDEATPLLWVLRDHLGLVGTKYGCGVAQCGACTCMNGAPVRSCSMPVAPRRISRSRRSRASPQGGKLHPLQPAWIEHDVHNAATARPDRSCPPPRCSKQKPNPTDADIDAAMNGNLCRCGTYPRIRKAIHAAAKSAERVRCHMSAVETIDPARPTTTYDSSMRAVDARWRALQRR